MDNKSHAYELNLVPKFGFCNDVQLDTCPARKIIWLVPHVIRHKGDEELVTWRCNWGNVCKSACLYAMARKQIEGISVTTKITQETELSLTNG
jgi:hypothetical protein